MLLNGADTSSEDTGHLRQERRDSAAEKALCIMDMHMQYSNLNIRPRLPASISTISAPLVHALT